MIIYCAADPIYFNYYFDLWAGQLNKFYPNHYKLIALYKPTNEVYDKCNYYNVNSVDVTNLFPENPTREHFYLLRWLNLPFYKNTNILATQINCLAVKTQEFPDIKVEQWRIQRPKRGYLGGVSAAIFTPKSAEKVVNHAKTLLDNPPLSDHPMNMWQIENLSQYQHKSEHQIKEKDLLPESVLPDYTYWITARTSNTWSHEKKIEALRKFI
jgi:hypothetical protein